ncbi:Phage terminase-like protein, large subunit [Leclercia adecarboxylata]|uniref:Phage terminase-like protein, large subunit n=3 Tax=Leclercia adecarboxylata TaxID=83655 RepID=A0A4U9HRD3_9ENTR|nr:Phage terminase-like protein, large subunit [Leclercia adecarboxylata]
MTSKAYPNVNAANQYARDIVRGKTVACRYVIDACQRHLDDLAKEKTKKFLYRFDKDLAEKAAKFIQLLPHTKGEWAFKRMPITLEPWQLFIVCSAFGWVRKGSKLRRFREVYTEIPRKNGKSAISAGVALFCFTCDDEFGAEVYSGATTEKQAWEVFRPARLMCKRTPALCDAFGVEVNASNMNRPEDGARLEPLIGNPGDGASPSCAIVDEYHEHDTDALYTTMLTGMGARRQPLMWAITTTAGYNIEGPCYDKRREVIEMLNGTVPNDELFGVIYTVDEGDDWTDPAVLRKANPNMGISVYSDFLLSQQKRAMNNARQANVFKTKHLNIWVSARAAYFNLVSWRNCEDETLTIEQFEGQPCYLSFDLARKLDMNSMVRIFTRDIDGRRHYYCVAPKFWVPYDTVYSTDTDHQRTAERFQKWVNSGHLDVTEGAEIDYRVILEEAKAVNRQNPVEESAIDPHGATNLSHHLADEGLSPITIVQNYTNMSDPMKELEAAIEAGRFHHDGHPILTWCISNVVGKHLPGNDDVVRPIKEHSENKIDGATALIMDIGRAMLPETRQDLNGFFENPIMVGF